MYGKELILDLHDCDINLFNREDILIYFINLCDLIDMEACDLHFWISEEEEEKDPKIFGISAIQFILTSNITIHTLPLLKKVFINIFSCKDFDCAIAEVFSVNYFKGTVVNSQEINRI